MSCDWEGASRWVVKLNCSLQDNIEKIIAALMWFLKKKIFFHLYQRKQNKPKNKNKHPKYWPTLSLPLLKECHHITNDYINESEIIINEKDSGAPYLSFEYFMIGTSGFIGSNIYKEFNIN